MCLHGLLMCVVAHSNCEEKKGEQAQVNIWGTEQAKKHEPSSIFNQTAQTLTDKNYAQSKYTNDKKNKLQVEW